ncbi:hypothetical protein N665_0451s0027 [Sinapis alba]|nr:hypothetical protein N665_0451s0027 [Sinapis alba]
MYNNTLPPLPAQRPDKYVVIFPVYKTQDTSNKQNTSTKTQDKHANGYYLCLKTLYHSLQED